ncbi:hypothetical protein BESB_015820 [Besnoitia besnoiti]|uniref:Phosphorylated adapter RNA export protein n=1 Tax=Besnoitia besnoiti TaxID=94643 RepID=A0A2A9M4X6_BESBE|nr:hypothetical protein BESB_015820 [Besnoitia besnoiti]PFH32264.1 hypothetical protein BESB_015820 [Besnoitia besnoiti]
MPSRAFASASAPTSAPSGASFASSSAFSASSVSGHISAWWSQLEELQGLEGGGARPLSSPSPKPLRAASRPPSPSSSSQALSEAAHSATSRTWCGAEKDAQKEVEKIVVLRPAPPRDGPRVDSPATPQAPNGLRGEAGLIRPSLSSPTHAPSPADSAAPEKPAGEPRVVLRERDPSGGGGVSLPSSACFVFGAAAAERGGRTRALGGSGGGRRCEAACADGCGDTERGGGGRAGAGAPTPSSQRRRGCVRLRAREAEAESDGVSGAERAGGRKRARRPAERGSGRESEKRRSEARAEDEAQERDEETRQQIFDAIKILVDPEEIEALVAILTQLKEKNIALFERAVHRRGVEECTAVLQETLDIEEAGGQLLPCGRRKSPGGVFLKLLQNRISPEDKKFIWDEQNRAQKERKKQILRDAKKRQEEAALRREGLLGAASANELRAPPQGDGCGNPAGVCSRQRVSDDEDEEGQCSDGDARSPETKQQRNFEP